MSAQAIQQKSETPDVGWFMAALTVLFFAGVVTTFFVLCIVQVLVDELRERVFGKPLEEWQAALLIATIGFLALVLVI
jgi:NADH:ubiquinone oxidoreductase subunit 6 (subunit J)